MTNVEDFKIVKVVNTALFKINRVGSGALPDEYKGMYTQPTLAQKDIEKYVLGINLEEAVVAAAELEKERMVLSPRKSKAN